LRVVRWPKATRAKPMTEAEWLACPDPDELLGFLFGRVSNRKLWLFGVACCRRLWHLLEDHRSREAVEVVERFAEGQASVTEWLAAYKEASKAAACSQGGPALAAYDLVTPANAFEAVTVASRRAAGVTADATGSEPAAAVENAAQVLLLHDIFGSPLFRPLTIHPGWLTWGGGTARRLAEAAYTERQLPSGYLDQARLGVLADALEEAGCQEAHLLDHLRGTGPHVRGCWALDALLGKS
jgi:hypothetical protein